MEIFIAIYIIGYVVTTIWEMISAYKYHDDPDWKKKETYVWYTIGLFLAWPAILYILIDVEIALRMKKY